MDDKVIHHPYYGTLPLAPFSYGLTDEFRRVAGLPPGTLDYFWRPDPKFKPELPPGAVRGDPSKQDYDLWGDVPYYYYLDVAGTCLDCRRPTVFYARQQRYVYEQLRCNYNYRFILRCSDCRRRRRQVKNIRREFSQAARQAKKYSTNAAAQLRLARALLDQKQLSGEGNLKRALAAAQRAGQLDTTNPEPIYWQAAILSAGQQPYEALRLYREFVAQAGHESRLQALVEIAQAYITNHSQNPKAMTEVGDTEQAGLTVNE